MCQICWYASRFRPNAPLSAAGSFASLTRHRVGMLYAATLSMCAIAATPILANPFSPLWCRSPYLHPTCVVPLRRQPRAVGTGGLLWEIWPSHVLQYAHKCSVRTPASLCHCTRFALPVIATITPVSNWRQPIIRQITVTLLQYAPSIEDVLSDLSPRGFIQTSVTKEEPWGCCSCSVCLPLWPSPSGCSEHLHCS